MQSNASRASSAIARLCARIAGLPLGGFAAPPPTMVDAMNPDPGTVEGPRPEPTVRIEHRPPSDVRRPIRWTSLSAVR